MAKWDSITQSRVKELYDYREDGNLIRRIAVGGEHGGRWKAGRTVGWAHNAGYIETAVDGTRCLLHRVIFVWHHGYHPVQIDHKNGIRSDNRIENLRSVTPQQNQWNRVSKGYFFFKPHGLWRAEIRINDKAKHLGYFKTEDEARSAYLDAKSRIHLIDGEVANCKRA